MTTILSARGISRTFGAGETAVHALADVSLDLSAGELVVLSGPSGSGKTTLLNILSGLDAPTAGTVTIDGVDVPDMREPELSTLRQCEIGFVFQGFALLPMLSAAENVEVPLRLIRTRRDERAGRVAELLDAVGLADHAGQRPYELSGGQQQRVGIARALANRPALLFADEPTGQLDSGTGAQIMQLIARLVHDEGLAAIVSTHDQRIGEYADRHLHLVDGRLLRQ